VTSFSVAVGNRCVRRPGCLHLQGKSSPLWKPQIFFSGCPQHHMLQKLFYQARNKTWYKSFVPMNRSFQTTKTRLVQVITKQLHTRIWLTQNRTACTKQTALGAIFRHTGAQTRW